jgi:cobyrinic acid a,c-diamide synthase
MNPKHLHNEGMVSPGSDMPKVSDSAFPRVMLAAPHGRSGKTVITLGVLRCLKNRGLEVQAFKKGPDFIDTGWHTLASKRASRNLDAYFMQPQQINELVRELSVDTRLSFIEGAMGIYDGLDSEGSCSSAELAKVTNTPIVLVVDVTRMTRTTAALIMGCQVFDPDIQIRGIILNKARGSRQENLVRKTIAEHCRIPVIGAIPNSDNLVIPDRHLGLLSSSEVSAGDLILDEMAEVVSRYVDIDALIGIADSADLMESEREESCALGASGKSSELQIDGPLQLSTAQSSSTTLLTQVYASPTIDLLGTSVQADQYYLVDPLVEQKIRIAVIRDSIFCFYYQENLDALKRLGAELVFVNSLQDKTLPADIHALYIGGGFPEVFAEALEANRGLLGSIKNYAKRGLPIYAECGGLMLLSRAIIDKGKTYQMSGVLPMDTVMRKQRQGHGYSTIVSDEQNPWFTPGTTLKGHEYHYSEIINRDSSLNCAFKVVRGRGFGDKREGICSKEVFASYTHVNAYASPIWAERMVEKARMFANIRSAFEMAVIKPEVSELAESLY